MHRTRFFSLIAIFVLVTSITIVKIPTANAGVIPAFGRSAYIDPYTGDFVGIGELSQYALQNYPWSNVVIKFNFSPNGGYFSEVDGNVSITNPENNSDLNSNGYKGNTGNYSYTFNVPPSVTLPFAVTKSFIQKSKTNGADNLGYEGVPDAGKPLNWTGKWKPADLIVSVDKIVPTKNITSAFNNQNYTRWAVIGTALNNQSGTIDNVHVVAGINGNRTGIQGCCSLVGVAGYGSLAEEERKAANQTGGLPFAHMAGFEKRNFTLYYTIPSDWKPTSAYLYAESDQSVMLYPGYQPLVADYDVSGLTYGNGAVLSPYSNNTITFMTNITNTSRQDMQFDWILQIVKVPFNGSTSEQYLQKYIDNGTTEHIEVIHSVVKAQNGRESIHYDWHPTSSGYYAHAIYIVNDINKPHLIATPYQYMPNVFYPAIMYNELFYYVPVKSG